MSQEYIVWLVNKSPNKSPNKYPCSMSCGCWCISRL